MTHILGISAFYHDSAACLVRDGRILAAAQEERFTRKRHDADFPARAIERCLAFAGVGPAQLDAIVFYEKPFLKFERILDTYLRQAPRGWESFVRAMPVWIKQKIWIKDLLLERLGRDRLVLFAEHHESHAASAFYPSPFEEAAILTMDGVGEWTTTSIAVGEGSKIRILKEIRFPHSLGLLYSAFTYYTGFRVNSGEYKVMGLAPYGRPVYKDLILGELIDLKDDGSFRLNTRYFGYLSGLTMTNRRFHDLFGGPPRKPEAPVTQREMDLARSVQDVTEEVMVRAARHAIEVTGKSDLCLAGGVALNCVGNGRIARDGACRRVWVQPASGDAGGALGAALTVWHHRFGGKRESGRDQMSGALLGPSYSDAEIRSFLDERRIPYEPLEERALVERTANLLAEGKVVGWFQGRMEFGPRALGARSILGDPRDPGMQERMNLKIKYRESFRPFAPAVLRERAADYFELTQESPYMLLVAPVKAQRRVPVPAETERLFGIERLKVARSTIPAVTHVDYSARVQTVGPEESGIFYRLLRAFEDRTGCPVLVNTSFNVRGEPLVCSPEEAYRCFRRTQIDFLVLGGCLIDKSAQPEWTEAGDWRREIPLD